VLELMEVGLCLAEINVSLKEGDGDIQLVKHRAKLRVRGGVRLIQDASNICDPVEEVQPL